jgi:hypothetical protein
MAKASTKAVVPANQATNLPATLEDVSAFDGIGSGFENVTARDLLIPRLTIIQGLSPQVSQGKAEYDPDAKVGDVYDVGLQQRFPEGITFIPVFYQKQWLEWAPRASGKGLQRIHDSELVLNECTKDEKTGRQVLPNGNYIVETAQMYGLNVTAEFRKSFIPMASTQLKKARRILTLATSEKLKRADGSTFTPPLFYRAYALSSVPESNNEGNWMGWKVERAMALTEFPHWKNLLEEIKEFRESLAAGTIRGDVAAMEADAGGPVIDGNAPM